MECNKDYLRLIKEALEQRRLAFFIGAGVSKATNKNYPSWTKVTETLRKGLSECDETDPLKIAQLYALKFGNLKLKESVKSLFPIKDIPSDIQQAILDLKPHYVISTNWDCLFENFINKKISYIYDVIASDSELVQSKNDSKIIKMHGDFSHNNYVLTEDDYLNYSKDFPLIENYVKSIISTHTIVMLGYSFSDIDLKQLVNWVQKHSSVQHPIYMLVNQKNEYSEMYLQKFGIITITQENISQDNYLIHFLNDLANLADYSNSPVDFVYNKIKKYENYHVVLQSDICKSLDHCELLYNSHNNGIIHFFDYKSINEEDNIIRGFYKQFLNNLDTNDGTTKKIFDILLKANITGIITSKNEKGHYQYESFADLCEYSESPMLNFDFSPKKSKDPTQDLIKKTFCLSELGKAYDAFETNRQLISHCEKTRNYAYLFVGFFNHNQLLNHLQLLSKDTRELVKQEKTHPLDDLYISFPKNIQQDYREIYLFLTQKTLHELHFEITKSIKEKEQKIEVIERYDTDLSSEHSKYQSTLKNLINFVLKNGISIENYSLYREICQKYIKISFLKQHDEQTITLNKTELYVCIKYFSSSELQHLFKDIWKPSKRKSFKLDRPLLNWLIDEALKKCVYYFIHEDRSIVYTHFDHYIENTLFLLAQNELSENQLDRIWGILNELVNEAQNTLTIFKAIDTFVAIQWNLYKKSFNEKQIIALIENLLNKFSYRKTNYQEEMALSLNQINNLYYSCRVIQSKFTSDSIISHVIQNIDNLEQHERISFIQNVLLELYQISDKKCKSQIRKYAQKQKFIVSNNFDSLLEVLNYRLHLAALDIEKDTNGICQMTEKVLKEYPDKAYYYSIGTTANLLDFLQKKDASYSATNQKVQQLVKELNKKFGHT